MSSPSYNSTTIGGSAGLSQAAEARRSPICRPRTTNRPLVDLERAWAGSRRAGLGRVVAQLSLPDDIRRPNGPGPAPEGPGWGASWPSMSSGRHSAAERAWAGSRRAGLGRVVAQLSLPDDIRRPNGPGPAPEGPGWGASSPSCRCRTIFGGRTGLGRLPKGRAGARRRPVVVAGRHSAAERAWAGSRRAGLGRVVAQLSLRDDIRRPNARAWAGSRGATPRPRSSWMGGAGKAPPGPKASAPQGA